MDKDGNVVALITAWSDDEANKIAEALVKQRKAACVNILPGVRSVFWWQGSIDSEQELLLIAKTKKSKVEQIVSLVKKLHSYDTPEIIALPITGGSLDYLDWIDREVQ
jgi:periplasmic divalent cation tolerance protein